VHCTEPEKKEKEKKKPEAMFPPPTPVRPTPTNTTTNTGTTNTPPRRGLLLGSPELTQPSRRVVCQRRAAAASGGEWPVMRSRLMASVNAPAS
jgi:hypothetical protein